MHAQWRMLAAMLVVAVVGIVGCKKGGETAGKRKITIGMVAKSQSNDVFQAGYAGAKDAAVELGRKYNVEVVIDWRTPPAEDAQKQAEAIEALTRAGADGITISCSEANTVTPAIDKAAAKGIPVMCFDSDAPNSKRFCYYGTDDADCGKRVMVELARAMGEKGTIAILAGNQSAPNLQARMAAVRAQLKQYPQMQELNGGKGVFYHEETPEKAMETMMTAQTANPGIQGWALIGGWPLFAEGGIRNKWKAGEIKIVSVDALPPELNYLRSGHVEVLLAQDCYGWGYKSVEILLEKIVNKKDPPSTKIYDPLKRVTKENADEVGQMWKKWLGK